MGAVGQPGLLAQLYSGVSLCLLGASVLSAQTRTLGLLNPRMPFGSGVPVTMETCLLTTFNPIVELVSSGTLTKGRH